MPYSHAYRQHYKGDVIGRTYCGHPLWKLALREMIRVNVKDVTCKQCLRRHASKESK